MAPRILHLMPYDGIGGVELAARSMPVGEVGGLEVHRLYIADKGTGIDGPFDHLGPYPSENDPRNHAFALRRIAALKPDLLIASLWRTVPVALAAKARLRDMKLAAFLHLPHDVHRIDALLTRALMAPADAIWCDSVATRDARVPPLRRADARVISFLLNRPTLRSPRDLAPHFAFWGRLNWQKGLDRAIDLFARIHARHPDATFTIIGPDGGAEADLKAQVHRLDLATAVRFTGPLPQSEIARQTAHSSYFLHASKAEGMALSVVEAMQAGIVPLVTPVGEIPDYAVDGTSALFLDGQTDADRIEALLSDSPRFRAMSTAAMQAFATRPLYRDDILAAARDLLEKA